MAFNTIDPQMFYFNQLHKSTVVYIFCFTDKQSWVIPQAILGHSMIDLQKNFQPWDEFLM